MPVRYEALSALQFWKISAKLARSDVETSESFSQLWLALGSPIFWCERSFWRWLRKCNQFLARARESMTPHLTIGQSGFVEIWPNSVRFSTFLSTEWEFLHAVFTTMRYFDHKKRKKERLGS